MPDNRRNFVNQLLEMWTRLQGPQRLTIIFFAFVSMALIGSIAYFMNRVEYEALYWDMNPDDVRAVAAKLEASKKYKYKVEGSSILVAAPRDEIGKLQLEYSGSGLAQSGKVGYELLDKNQFGMTDFVQQINYQRALEGELAKTISTLSEIRNARVFIVMSKDSFFEGNKDEAKASVVLTLKKGADLSKSSIAGIKGVIAGSVFGLRPRNISIMDNEGRFLAQATESGDAGRAEMESGVREQLERELSGKVVSILEPLVGTGKVRANASIDLDFNSMEQTEETFKPDPPAVVSHQKSEERSGGQSSTSGVPGTQSNVGPAVAQTLPPSSERLRQNEVTNYEVSRLVRHTVQPKGTVRRLSVAVALDNKTVAGKTKEGKPASHSEPLSPQELNAYRDLIRATVGFNEARGDVVTMQNVAFYSESNQEEPPAAAAPWYMKWQTQTYVMPGIKYAAFIILFIIAYLVFVRPIRKRMFQAFSTAALPQRASGEPQLTSGNAPRALSGAGQPEQIAAPASAPAASLPAGEIHLPEEAVSLESAGDEQIERELMKEASVMDMGNRKYSVMKKKMVEKARKDPEVVSQLVRTLLREKA
jgi:flagellar M-ring protein FliF